MILGRRPLSPQERLTPHLPAAFHVEPYYAESVHAVLEDLILREEAVMLQLCQLKTPSGRGLGSDGTPLGNSSGGSIVASLSKCQLN